MGKEEVPTVRGEGDVSGGEGGDGDKMIFGTLIATIDPNTG